MKQHIDNIQKCRASQ